MEPAKIDWKNVESVFVKDERFEHINAPTWVDFVKLDDHAEDDEAWFCRPDCKHPKTAEDFLKSTPPKHSSSASYSLMFPLRNQNRRDAKLKRRAGHPSKLLSDADKINGDSENQNPNFWSPVLHPVKSLKAAIKSSAEKKPQTDDTLQKDDAPRLKSTLSARNLFAGRDILNHITEFCGELKKLAGRVKESEDDEKLNEKDFEDDVKEESQKKESREVFGELDGKMKERTPLTEVNKEKWAAVENSSAKNKQRLKKRTDDAENTPISLNLEKVRGKGDDAQAHIRTNPPTPQCFSATRGALSTTPSKAKPILMEKGILQEVEQNKEAQKNEPVDKEKGLSILEGKETRTLDVFWFLKPCTLSS